MDVEVRGGLRPRASTRPAGSSSSRRDPRRLATGEVGGGRRWTARRRLDDSERAELHAAIMAAEAELDAGQAITEDELWVRLRAAR